MANAGVGAQKIRMLLFGISLLTILFLSLARLYLADQSLADLQRHGVVRIGYAVEAPFAIPGPDGQATGESPEVARKIVDLLHIPRIEWIQTEFDNLIPDLQNNRFDVIAAGMFITPERAKQISFSLPTFMVQQGLLVRKGNPRKLHSYSQLAQVDDIKVAVIAGSIEEQILEKSGLGQPNLISVPDALTGRISVETGNIDAMALSSPAINHMVSANPGSDIEVAMPFEQPVASGSERIGIGAFGFRKRDEALLDAWNRALTKFIGTPEHASLIAKFGFSTAEIPSTGYEREMASP